MKLQSSILVFLFLLSSNLISAQEVDKVPEVPVENPDVMPEFPGGQAEMIKFVQSNLVYPIMEKEANISGMCYVTFVVEKDGSISGIKMLRGVSGGPGCDKEAMRVIALMPKWTPGKKDGKEVRVQFNMPFKFALRNTNTTKSEK